VVVCVERQREERERGSDEREDGFGVLVANFWLIKHLAEFLFSEVTFLANHG